MYQPYIIADHALGVYEGKKPWISPADAFKRIENARVFRGRILKRLGWKHFSTLGTKVVSENGGTLIGGETLIGFNPTPGQVDFPVEPNNMAQIAHLPVLPPLPSRAVYSITIVAPPWTFKCMDGFGPAGPNSATWFMEKTAGPAIDPATIVQIDHVSGRWYIALSGVDVFIAGTVTITYEYNRGLPVTGMAEFVDAAGVQQFVATDTRRLWKWDSVATRMVDVPAADVWTGDGTHVMQITRYRDTLSLNNAKDKPRLYDPIGGLRTQKTDLTTPGGSAEDIARCWQTLAFKNRLLIFRPTEGGTDLVRSFRWLRVNQLETMEGQDISEIPTEARFMQARVIGDRCIIFCDTPGETFELVPEDEPTAPWSLRRLRGEGDASSRLGGANFLDEALIWGQARLLRCDGSEAMRVYQDEVPDVVSDSNAVAPGNTIGIHADVLEEVWLGFTPANKEWPDRVIAVNARTRAIMFYTHAVHALGRFRQTVGLIYTWANAPGTWEQAQFAWNDGSLRAGFPLILAGDRSSRIFNTVSSQYGDDVVSAAEIATPQGFEMLLETEALNPYARAGGVSFSAARLGMVDVVAEAVQDGTLTVEVQSSFAKGDPTLVEEIDLSPATPGDETVVRRVFVNRVSEGHVIRIRDSSTGRRAIEGLVCHFSPSAPIRKVA